MDHHSPRRRFGVPTRLNRSVTAVGTLCLWLYSGLSLPSPAANTATSPVNGTPKVDFATEVRTILVQHCYDCHGPDDREGGLRLSDQASVFNALPSGRTAVVPGDPASSELLRRVSSHDPDQRMPPRGHGLSPAEVALIERWIHQGAGWDDTHWAFAPLEQPEPPAVSDTNWVRQPLDHFVLARLEREGVTPNPEADAHTLVRRLYLDLLGLPPTPDQVRDFVDDPSPDAWSRLVDQLLDNPHFGERWGRHWLDIARYADTDGYLNDHDRPDAWRYRDWVIDAINSDLPYDRFTELQLAGDLIEDAGPAGLLATAFHRQTLTNREDGVDAELYRVEAVFDRVETTSQTWLGLTANCARCHDHKYDHFSQEDYFRLFATFDDAEETEARLPPTEAELADYQSQLESHRTELAELTRQQQARQQQLAAGLDAWATELKTAIHADNPDAGQADEPLRLQAAAPRVIAAYADSGVQLTALDDGSHLASGADPDRVKYTVDLHVERRDVVGFQLEALPHPDLPAEGPGRAGDGGFVITEMRVFAKDGPDVRGGDRLPMQLADPETPGVEALLTAAPPVTGAADYPPQAAIDGNRRTSGWGIDASMAGQPLAAVYLLEQPLAVEELTSVRFVIDQQYGRDGATLGRFRLSLVTSSALPSGNGQAAPQVDGELRQLVGIPPAQWTDAQRDTLLQARLEQDQPLNELAAQLETLTKEQPSEPVARVRVMRERSNPKTTHLMIRGEYERPGAELAPGGIAVLHPLEPGDGRDRVNRLDLARWLMADDNHLTPRVSANHLWLHLFGEGLVRSPEDFGVRGDPPTHPDLLDWLAAEYRRLGWSRKAMIRTIVDSATYRMASDHRPELASTDPGNRLLHRQNRFRVEAEIVRDLALSVAGLLHPQIGGRSVFPPMQEDPTRARAYRWNTETDQQRHRRGLYTYFKRTAPFPTLITFDCPDSTLSVVQRPRSNTPLQALTALNNEVFVEAALAFAQRVHHTADNDRDRLTTAFAAAVARPPDDAELDHLQALLDRGRQHYRSHPDHARSLLAPHRGFVDLPPADNDDEVAELAALTLVTGALMNLDEFHTRP